MLASFNGPRCIVSPPRAAEFSTSCIKLPFNRIWKTSAGARITRLISFQARRVLSAQIHAGLTCFVYRCAMTKPANPFRYFDSSPEVIRLVVMMYVRSHGDSWVKSSDVLAHLPAPAATT
jgi:hypothetical protein